MTLYRLGFWGCGGTWADSLRSKPATNPATQVRVFSLENPPTRSHYDTLSCSKIHKKHYDKSLNFFHHILFAKNYDKKSYKMDIYKTLPIVYNISPE